MTYRTQYFHFVIISCDVYCLQLLPSRPLFFGCPSCPCGAVWWQTISVKIFQKGIHVVSEEPGAPHLCVCVCHHTGTYFHGYGDPGWSMKAGLLQTSLCALITALCVSYPAVRVGKRDRESWMTMQSLWEKRCRSQQTKIQQKWSTREWRKAARWRVVIRLL